MLRRASLARCNAGAAAAAAAAAMPKDGDARSPLHVASANLLPTFPDYMQRDEAELERLLAQRKAQASELRTLYERAHTNVEYFFRKQKLDHDEKAAIFAQGMRGSQDSMVTSERWALRDMRAEKDTSGRMRGAIAWACFFATVIFWWQLKKRFVVVKDTGDKGITGNMTKTFGGLGVIDSDTFLVGKSVPTDWELDEEARRRDAGLPARRTTEPPRKDWITVEREMDAARDRLRAAKAASANPGSRASSAAAADANKA